MAAPEETTAAVARRATEGGVGILRPRRRDSKQTESLATPPSTQEGEGEGVVVVTAAILGSQRVRADPEDQEERVS